MAGMPTSVIILAVGHKEACSLLCWPFQGALNVLHKFTVEHPLSFCGYGPEPNVRQEGVENFEQLVVQGYWASSQSLSLICTCSCLTGLCQ